MKKIDGGDFPPKNLQSDANVASSSNIPRRKLARKLDFTTPLLPAHPQQQQPQPLPRPLMPVVKPESPRCRPRSMLEDKDGTPMKQRECNCRSTRCLKRYCECFAAGVYCDGCNCVDCSNNADNDSSGQEAVAATLERNPNAFRPKIASSPNSMQDIREEKVPIIVKHNKGCHCKKSGCLKKYCECFQGNIICSENCKCMDCKNFEGIKERQRLYHADHNSSFHMQKELVIGAAPKDPSVQRLAPFPQVTYRSLLADTIQTQDVQALCSHLVVISQEASKTLAERNRTTEKHPEREDQLESNPASSNEGKETTHEENGIKKTLSNDRSSGDLGDKVGTEDCGSDDTDLLTRRPMSPGTQALMCDEQDTMFMPAASTSGAFGHGQNTPHNLSSGKHQRDIYAEQERLVLTAFRDCLQRIIRRGIIKEQRYSLLSRTETSSQPEHVGNGIVENPQSATAEISQAIPPVSIPSDYEKSTDGKSDVKKGSKD